MREGLVDAAALPEPNKIFFAAICGVMVYKCVTA